MVSCGGTFMRENKYPNELPPLPNPPNTLWLWRDCHPCLISTICYPGSEIWLILYWIFFFCAPFISTGLPDKLFDHKALLSAKSHVGSLWLMILPFVLRKVGESAQACKSILLLKRECQGHDRGRRQTKSMLRMKVGIMMNWRVFFFFFPDRGRSVDPW